MSIRSYILFVFFGISAIDWLISLMSFSLEIKRKKKRRQALIVLCSGEIGGPRGTRTDQGGCYRKGGPVCEIGREDTYLYF